MRNVFGNLWIISRVIRHKVCVNWSATSSHSHLSIPYGRTRNVRHSFVIGSDKTVSVFSLRRFADSFPFYLAPIRMWRAYGVKRRKLKSKMTVHGKCLQWALVREHELVYWHGQSSLLSLTENARAETFFLAVPFSDDFTFAPRSVSVPP